jgi:hypothetical protein
VITNVTNILIAVAAVIGLVPLGVRSVVDMIKNRRRKKNSDMWLTVAVSVIASHAAPAVLTELTERLGAVAEQLPPWAKAALGSSPQQPPAATAEPAVPQTSQAEAPPPEPSHDGENSSTRLNNAPSR